MIDLKQRRAIFLGRVQNTIWKMTTGVNFVNGILKPGWMKYTSTQRFSHAV